MRRMSEPSSPYYPPRAGWNRHLYAALYAARRHLHLENLSLPRPAIPVTFRQLVFNLAVPGYAFVQAGWPRIGMAVAAGWVVAALVFLVWLGYAAANIAFGLMMSLHVSSILHFLNRVGPGLSVWRRLGFSLVVLFVVGNLLYASGLRWMQSHLFLPLRADGQVYVIHPRVRPTALQRGDWVACESKGGGYANVNIHSGYLLGPVLALPGDVIEFGADEFQVDGTTGQRQPLMPSGGRLTLDEKSWLVWPALRTVTRYNASQQDIERAVLQMAQIRREQMIGQPYRRWFWRQQIP